MGVRWGGGGGKLTLLGSELIKNEIPPPPPKLGRSKIKMDQSTRIFFNSYEITV